MTFKVEILQLLVNTGKTSAQNSLYTMQITMLFRFVIQFHSIFAYIRQQFGWKQKQIEDTNYRHKNPHLSKFKHGKAFIPGFQYHAMHHQVCRSTDQCTYTSQNRDIWKRYQEFRCRKFYRLCPALYYRGKNYNNRSIVQESGNKGNYRQHSKLSLENRSFTLRKQFLYKLSQCTWLAYTFTD